MATVSSWGYQRLAPVVVSGEGLPGHGPPAKTDWATAVDEQWGEGLPTTEKLALLDAAVQAVDERYAAFQHLDVDLDSLVARYRPLVAAGLSRGAFAALMGRLSLDMLEAHTYIADLPVVYGTPLQPDTPIFQVGGWHNNYRFGASLTVLPDSSLLVYRVVPDHPLGLEPGDIVLGYEGVPWKQQYPELIAAGLPLRNQWVWGSDAESCSHAFLMSAGLNWHLFDTIDLVRYATGDTVHLDTSPLQELVSPIFGNEQLPIPGVPMYDTFQNEWISWGIIEGTRIGYIYWANCDNDPVLAQQLHAAVDSLMNHHETDGMII
ncbi:MAG: hypothetical protein ABIF77_18060, partial [bacterium]